VAALLLAAAAPRADTHRSSPYVGVTVIDRAEVVPRPVRMHIVLIDTRAPGIRFKVSPPGGTREVVRQTTRDFLKSERAQVAVNGHFFLPFPSADADAWVIGLAASEGRVYSAFETPEQNYALVADAPALNIDHRNRPRVVHRDTRKTDGMHVRERGRLWNVVAGSSQIVTEGRATIPAYRDVTHPRGALTPGGPSNYSNDKSWNDVATARTVIGLSRDRRVLTLFTVDARGGSEGLRLAEIAELLVRDYGVWDAINLDGGGSTSMAWENPETGQVELLNTSSDSPDGRAVASSLAVYARRR
jgi:exopolysaccharide biosynthesis protein